MDRQDILLLGVLTGTIPLDDPRADLGRFDPGELLGGMNVGNDAFDRAVAKHLAGCLEEMTFSEMTWFWNELDDYQSRTGDTSLGAEKKALAFSVMTALDAVDPDDGDFGVFLDACLDVIGEVPPFRAHAERMLEERIDRIDGFGNLGCAFGAYEDNGATPPKWLVDRAMILLADSSICEIDQIEELAELPVAEPVALAAYRTRIASLYIVLLLDLAPKNIAFARAWSRELFGSNRKAELAELLAPK